MHKRFVNYCTIDLTISPRGPMLIKSGKEGADPTKPDMEFVETYHQGGRSIYLPGSSLKGAIRAHAERIVRTVGTDTPSNTKIWASDPLDRNAFRELEREKDSHQVYRLSSFTDQMFGSTAISSRVRIEDAYPLDRGQIKIEERNGVAIDRVFGSVAVGPFNYQVCTAGQFRTKIHLKNFTLAQLGLIGLVLRDLNDGWFGLGFAKSRGMGLVEVKLNKATVQYPGCIIDKETGQIRHLGSSQSWDPRTLLGVTQFFNPDNKEQNDAKKLYGYDKFKKDIYTGLPVAGKAMELGFGVELIWEGEMQIKGDLLRRAVESWSALLGVAS
jgi:CRISPR-associated RAMP protein (TIGR02581 family)